MTVKDLIKALMALPGDAPVVIPHEGETTIDIVEVSVDRDADGEVITVRLS